MQRLLFTLFIATAMLLGFSVKTQAGAIPCDGEWEVTLTQSIELAPEIHGGSSADLENSTFYENRVVVTFVGIGQQIYLSSAPDRLADIMTDDLARVLVRDPDREWQMDFRDDAHLGVSAQPAPEITHLFSPGANIVQFIAQDLQGSGYGSTPYYIQIWQRTCADNEAVAEQVQREADGDPEATPVSQLTDSMMDESGRNKNVPSFMRLGRIAFYGFVGLNLMAALALAGTWLVWLFRYRFTQLPGSIEVLRNGQYVTTIALPSLNKRVITIGSRGDIFLRDDIHLPEIIARIRRAGNGTGKAELCMEVVSEEGPNVVTDTHLLTNGYSVQIGEYTFTYLNSEQTFEIEEGAVT